MNIKYLLASLGAFLCVFLIALIGEFDQGNIWLIPPFGASLVLVMALPKSPLAQPKNVIFGHISAASAGVLIFHIFGSNPLSIGLGLGLAVYLMLAIQTTHPRLEQILSWLYLEQNLWNLFLSLWLLGQF